jgi:hypothetical protein
MLPSVFSDDSTSNLGSIVDEQQQHQQHVRNPYKPHRVEALHASPSRSMALYVTSRWMAKFDYSKLEPLPRFFRGSPASPSSSLSASLVSLSLSSTPTSSVSVASSSRGGQESQSSTPYTMMKSAFASALRVLGGSGSSFNESDEWSALTVGSLQDWRDGVVPRECPSLALPAPPTTRPIVPAAAAPTTPARPRTHRSYSASTLVGGGGVSEDSLRCPDDVNARVETWLSTSYATSALDDDDSDSDSSPPVSPASDSRAFEFPPPSSASPAVPASAPALAPRLSWTPLARSNSMDSLSTKVPDESVAGAGAGTGAGAADAEPVELDVHNLPAEYYLNDGVVPLFSQWHPGACHPTRCVHHPLHAPRVPPAPSSPSSPVSTEREEGLPAPGIWHVHTIHAAETELEPGTGLGGKKTRKSGGGVPAGTNHSALMPRWHGTQPQKKFWYDMGRYLGMMDRALAPAMSVAAH